MPHYLSISLQQGRTTIQIYSLFLVMTFNYFSFSAQHLNLEYMTFKLFINIVSSSPTSLSFYLPSPNVLATPSIYSPTIPRLPLPCTSHRFRHPLSNLGSLSPCRTCTRSLKIAFSALPDCWFFCPFPFTACVLQGLVTSKSLLFSLSAVSSCVLV